MLQGPSSDITNLTFVTNEKKDLLPRNEVTFDKISTKYQAENYPTSATDRFHISRGHRLLVGEGFAHYHGDKWNRVDWAEEKKLDDAAVDQNPDACEYDTLVDRSSIVQEVRTVQVRGSVY